MRICLLGDFSGNPDEGMKNTARQLKDYLERDNEVIGIHPREVFYPGTLKTIRSMSPSIIHYLHGPSLPSLVLLKALEKIVPGTRTVALAIKPDLGKGSLPFIPFFKPDLTLVQSESTERFFRAIGFTTSFSPIGVDLERFFPLSVQERRALRKKHGLDESAFVVLHVGHLRKNRNLSVLTNIQQMPNVQIVIAASTHFEHETGIEEYLTQQGCIVWRRHFPNLNEIYNLADCYVFPLHPAKDLIESCRVGCCETPLSVLEAMAANLPVVTTRFGVLPRLFKEREGFYFVESYNGLDLTNKVKLIQQPNQVSTLEMVETHSWERVIENLGMVP